MYSACSKLSVQGHLAILKNPMIRMAANFQKKLVKYGVLILRTLFCSFKVVCIDGVDNCIGQLWKGSVDRSFLFLIKINPIVESGYFCSKHKTWSLHYCSCCESKYRRVWPGATEFKSLNDPIVESGYFCRKHKTWSLHCCSCCESKCRRVWPGATELKSLNVIPPVTLKIDLLSLI